ncbi:MAG: Anaerobic ribonucleoside-triphosphate reductase activating protein [Parcubacteria group bacterium GW2011_GWA2_44_12]|nr:MAG: Anaerobic ribonucleoside-triphosphate reductase activating protein [Parcubacteria group bacterium GW2011_GWA2_44_12]
MYIVGWQKVSATDYPGKIATIFFTKGCVISEETLLAFLKRRERLLEGVVISGGEPTIQHDLIDFMRKIKDLGYAIKLDTNGYSPSVLLRVIRLQLADYIAMDIKASAKKYSEVVNVSVDMDKIYESIALIQSSGILYEFRSTLVEGMHTDTDVREMAQMIEGAKMYFLQKFRAAPKLVDPVFTLKQSPSDEKMERFAKLCGEYVKRCEVR